MSPLSNTATDPDVRTAMVSEQMAAADAITAEPTKAKLHEYVEAHPEKYDQEGVMTLRDLVFPTDAEAIGTAQACASAQAVLARFHGRGWRRDAREDFCFPARIHLGDNCSQR